MNKEKALIQLKDLLYNFENFESVETTEDDVQALKYAIKELERTAQEVPVQEQYVTLKIDTKEIAKIVIAELKKQQKQSNITIIPV